MGLFFPSDRAAMVEKKAMELCGCELICGKPVGAYVAATIAGNLVYTSGQLPSRAGTMLATGKVGQDVTLEQAVECAKQCAFNVLAAVKSVVPDLSKIEKIVRINIFVNSAPGFTKQPAVADGASNFFVAVFGPAGQHTRVAIGVAELPLNVPVEIEGIFLLKSS